jgi:hypothetical protein
VDLRFALKGLICEMDIPVELAYPNIGPTLPNVLVSKGR